LTKPIRLTKAVKPDQRITRTKVVRDLWNAQYAVESPFSLLLACMPTADRVDKKSRSKLGWGFLDPLLDP
jgi:hypothetical protein